ncbi:MAG: CaiB/BaiF CoA transferase family protein [Novosphingobium sp.]
MEILKGIKVVDLTMWAFVPSAGGVMAHWGADVIKVENPMAPDPMRTMGGTVSPGGASDQFKHYSRGKKSIALDLTKPEGRELLYRLCEDADVFLTSYLRPTRQRLGVDVEHIRKINPDIVYARGSGYGPKGPEADRPGYDSIAWWFRGSLGQSAMDGNGSPWPTHMVGHGDGISGMVFAGGICAALLHRAMTGEALVVDSSLMGTAVWFNGLAIMAARHGQSQRTFRKAERPPPPAGVPADMVSALRQIYQTKDLRFINLLFLGDDDRDFVDLMQLIDRPELASDPRFTSARLRVANSADMLAILDETFASKTLDEWKKILVKARGAWAPIQTPEEIYDDPQTIANGFLSHVDYPTGGFKIPAPPILFNEEAGQVPRAPDFAEHTDEVLRGLGLDADAIDRYREIGAVR